MIGTSELGSRGYLAVMMTLLTSCTNIHLLLMMLGERVRGQGERIDGTPLFLYPLPFTLYPLPHLTRDFGSGARCDFTWLESAVHQSGERY